MLLSIFLSTSIVILVTFSNLSFNPLFIALVIYPVLKLKSCIVSYFFSYILYAFPPLYLIWALLKNDCFVAISYLCCVSCTMFLLFISCQLLTTFLQKSDCIGSTTSSPSGLTWHLVKHVRLTCFYNNDG